MNWSTNLWSTTVFVSLLVLSIVGSLTPVGKMGEYLSASISAPELVVKGFIDHYGIPEFVLKSIDPGLPDVLRDGVMLAYIIASEGIVLLKNVNNTLPLKPGEKVAVFGLAQHWTWNYHVGGSSFVEVSATRNVTLLEGLLNAGVLVDMELVNYYETHRRTYGGEPNITEDQVKYFAQRNNVAVVVIGRYATEGRDMAPSPGGYYLTPQERNLLDLVSRYFEKTVVVLNTAGPIEMAWDNKGIDAILWVGYPGEQGGNAVAAILLGMVSPSGKLPTTWAYTLEDYPSTPYFGKFDVTYWEDVYVGYRYFDTFNRTVAYPFGYGLSYTTFKIEVLGVELVGKHYVRVNVVVTNTGSYPGREVVQVYVSKPDGLVEKPYQELVAFTKTDVLKPGHSQALSIVFDFRSLASYSEKMSAWVLDAGEYVIRVGNSSRSTRVAAVFVLDELVVVEDTENRMHAPFINRLSKGGATPITYPGEQDEIARAPKLRIDPSAISCTNKTGQPAAIPEKFQAAGVEEVITLKDVWLGRYSLQQLVAQMSVEELVNLTVGLRGLPKYGVPELRQADGPNGLRSGPSPNPGGTAFPSATLLAASWNLELARVFGLQVGRELIWANITLWLAPGLNIHRNPLCGRSGEYLSEDPLLTGVMVAAITKGVQSNHGIGVTLKHFVGYEQEFNRFYSDSRISERALREIYLRPFEIAVKTSDPWVVMTSYNKVNGLYTGNDFNLLEGILRYEWGFNGFVMTDWGSGSYNWRAYYAGNDALMPYFPDGYNRVLNETIRALEAGWLTLGHLHRSAYNILKIAVRSRAFAHAVGVEQEMVYKYYPPPDYFEVVKSPLIVLETKTATHYITVLQTTQELKTVTVTEVSRETYLLTVVVTGIVALIVAIAICRLFIGRK